MYFWKINELKTELVKNGLSQKCMFVYILIYMLLGQFFLEISYIFPSEEPAVATDLIQVVFNLAVIGIGTYLCFYANGSNNGQQFAERYFSIGFVVGLRFIVLLIPIVICYGVVISILSATIGIDLDGPAFDSGIFAVLSTRIIAMYWRIVFHINEVAKAGTA